MSRKGNCWDNVVAESFFKSLKVEAITNAILKINTKPNELYLNILSHGIIRVGDTLIWEGLTMKEFEKLNQF